MKRLLPILEIFEFSDLKASLETEQYGSINKTHLGLLVTFDCFKRFLSLRAGLFYRLSFFDQHVTLTCLDVNIGLLLVDLRFPRLELFLFLLDLIMKYLGLIYRANECVIA